MMRKMLTTVAVALATVVAAPAMAQSTNVTFNLNENTTTVAGGSFSYLTGQTGILNYDNLTSFQFNDGANSFSLADVLANSGSNFQYLGYDTSSKSFVDTTTDGFTYYITSIAPNFNTGFYTDSGNQAGVNPGHMFVDDYASGTLTNFNNIVVQSSATTGAVPEPATWAMMMLGFGMIGFGLRRRSKVSTTVRFA